MVYANCSTACQRTCEAPEICQTLACGEAGVCVCPNGFFMKGNDCLPQQECGCYESQGQMIIPVC